MIGVNGSASTVTWRIVWPPGDRVVQAVRNRRWDSPRPRQPASESGPCSSTVAALSVAGSLRPRALSARQGDSDQDDHHASYRTDGDCFVSEGGAQQDRDGR